MNSLFFEGTESVFIKLVKALKCYRKEDFKKSEIDLKDYITTYSRISFNFLLIISVLLCGFLGFNSGGRQNKEDEYAEFIFGMFILGILMIFILYNFTNKNTQITNNLYIIFTVMVDAYFLTLIYDTNYIETSYVFYLRIIYFYFF